MTPDVPTPSPDTVQRVLAALQRSAAEARRVAAQTGTRLVVVRDGVLIRETVPESGRATNRGA